MELCEIIRRGCVLYEETAPADKYEILRKSLLNCLEHSELERHRESIWQTLAERERSMSTGIGLGVALPHCSTEFVTEALGHVTILKEGIDFQSVDEIPVRIIVLLILPKNKFEKHIRTLAGVAKMLNDEKFRQAILNAQSADEIFELINKEPTLRNSCEP